MAERTSQDSMKVWNELFPFKVGDKVRVIKSLLNPNKNRKDWLDRKKVIGRVGIITEYVDAVWKDMMIREGFYPECIRNETMYVLDIHTERYSRFAYRYCEIELVK